MKLSPLMNKTHYLRTSGHTQKFTASQTHVFTVPPASMRTGTTAWLPWKAWCRGEHWSLSRALMSAPASISSLTILAELNLAARCSTVLWVRNWCWVCNCLWIFLNCCFTRLKAESQSECYLWSTLPSWRRDLKSVFKEISVQLCPPAPHLLLLPVMYLIIWGNKLPPPAPPACSTPTCGGASS